MGVGIYIYIHMDLCGFRWIYVDLCGLISWD